MQEETGLKIEVDHIVAVNEAFIEANDFHILFITFKANIIDGVISIQDTNEIAEIKWLDVSAAEQVMTYYPKYPNGIEALLHSFSPYTFQGT